MVKHIGRHAGEVEGEYIIPNTPTIGTATDVGLNRPFNNGAATVTFTPAATGTSATYYTVTAYSVGTKTAITATGSSSPITITGLTSTGSYTFTVYASNSLGSSKESSQSNSVTITTVPDVAYNLSLVNNGQNYDYGTWTAPANNGGKAISNYHITDNQGHSYDTGVTTAYNWNESDNSVVSFSVYVDNANGRSAVSNSSNQVTTTPFSFAPFGFTPFSFTPFAFTPFSFTPFAFTPFSFTPFAFTPFSFTPFSFTPFSFTPFGFTPFGFTPFGFTPFGFTPFGFTPFGFTPFAFTPFGFTPFGFTPHFGFTPFGFTPHFSFTPFAFGYGNSLSLVSTVRTPDGVVPAISLSEESALLTSNIETNADIFDLTSWSDNKATVYGNELTYIKEISTRTSDTIVIVNGEYFTKEHFILVNRSGFVMFVNPQDLNPDTDQVWSYSMQNYKPLSQLQVINDTSYEVVTVKTLPNTWFYTEDILCYDSYTA